MRGGKTKGELPVCGKMISYNCPGEMSIIQLKIVAFAAKFVLAVVSRMRRAGRVCSILVCLGVSLWSAGLELQTPMLANAMDSLDKFYTMVQGSYVIKANQFNAGEGWTESELDPSLKEPLKLAARHQFVWAMAKGEYQIPAPSHIKLCAYWEDRERGSFALPPDVARPELTFILPSVSSADVSHRFVLEQVPSVANNRSPKPRQLAPISLRCQEHQQSAVMSRGLSTPGFVLASVQTQAQPAEVAYGELLLAFKTGAASADISLWRCLVTKGQLNLELVESGMPNQKVSVWPDGSFHAVIHRGATYGWWLGSSACGMSTRQYSASSLRVPEGLASTNEKIMLACRIAAGRFSDCRAWWLKHP